MFSPDYIGLVTAIVYAFIVIQVQTVALRFGVVNSMLCYLPIAWATMLVIYLGQLATGSARELPHIADTQILLKLGMLFALGQWLNGFAYSLGARPLAMSCLTMTIPLFVSLYFIYYKSEWPNWLEVGGYVLAFSGVFLISYNSYLKKAAETAAKIALQ
jgi:hypothetical protein